MQLVFGHDQAIAHWVASLIPAMAGRDFGNCSAIGVARGPTLLGGCVYHGWIPQYRSIEMSAAAADPRWLVGPPGDRRAILRALFRYPFVQLDCQRITMAVAKRNRPARAFAESFGFKREGSCRRGFGSDDAIIYGLLRAEWEAGPWSGGAPAVPPSASSTRTRARLEPVLELAA